LELIEKTTLDLSGEEIKLKLIHYSDKEIFVTIDKIIDNKHFTIKESLSNTDLSDNKIFVYGQEVDDFHILDKETIYTVGIAAIKKLDEDLTTTNKKLELAEKTIVEQSIIISNLQSQIDIINNKISSFTN